MIGQFLALFASFALFAVKDLDRKVREGNAKIAKDYP
jgi:hypothetical protein